MKSQPYLVELNPGYFEYQMPISVKAVIVWKGLIPLLRNERNEWELPGGKLELGESPEVTLAREIEEELAWEVKVSEPLHGWVYEIRPDRHVFVLAYRADYGGESQPVFSHEHKDLILVSVDQVAGLNMPDPYKRAIAIAVGQADR